MIMDQKMFCYQCEQTARGVACTGNAGVCGKPFDVALDQDELTGALVGLARTCLAAGTRSSHADELVIRGLFTCITNVNFSREAVRALTDELRAEKERLAARAGIDPVEDLLLGQVWADDENTRSLKSLVLFGLRGAAAYAYHARMLGSVSDEAQQTFVRALAALATESDGAALLDLALEVGKLSHDVMGLLDAANTGAYGNPEPTEVSLKVERGPFVVISGHDLRDLKLLLEQTEGTGVSVYTHGEMLPANAYPGLKRYPQLKGNFGTAWQNQQREFANVPAAFLFTTNCLMPPRPSYADRVFTTEVVSYPELVHVPQATDGTKDFTPVIEKARELGGYDHDVQLTGINGGTTVTTGFAHGTVLSIADKVIDAVRAGKIRHFFLVGGCDGAKPGRTYYTELVKRIPDDCVVLTLACGKYRFNDLDLGDIDGIPRLLDVGQCNDAYSAVEIALALAKAFDCSVNELPLSIVLSWYEQKAVADLLALLYLGITDIKLGPTLPAFVSRGVLGTLVEKFGLAPIATPEEDLAQMLA